jgi:TatD DNase family protein
MAVIFNLSIDIAGCFAFFSFLFLVLIVDSHAHLSMSAFDEDREEVIKSAFDHGIDAILCPAEVSEPKSIQITCELTEKHSHIFASGGVHPHHAKEFTEESTIEIEDLAIEKKIHAVGEIGLDFHYNFSTPEQQKYAFRSQLNIAKKMKLPVIIHNREAAQEILDIIQEEHYTQGGVVHCFTEDWPFAKKMLDLNFKISFSGIVTFPKAHELRETARKIPLQALLIETDAPYLVPYPYRGKNPDVKIWTAITKASILWQFKSEKNERRDQKLFQFPPEGKTHSR